MSLDRIALFPSRANLVLMKQRTLAAQKGLSLLKRKRDALELKLRELLHDLRAEKKKVKHVMTEAIFSLARANYLGTDFKPAAVGAAERADVFLRIRDTKVVGLRLPTFELCMKQSGSFPFTGLSRGGAQVEQIRQCFQEAIRLLVTMASLEFSVAALLDGVRQNNMRVNGLEYVIVPRFQNTANYIRDELEEFEREDFYRLKRSQAKQRKARKIFQELVRTKNEEAEERKKKPQSGIELGGAIDEQFNIENFEKPNMSTKSQTNNLSEEEILTEENGSNDLEEQPANENEEESEQNEEESEQNGEN